MMNLADIVQRLLGFGQQSQSGAVPAPTPTASPTPGPTPAPTDYRTNWTVYDAPHISTFSGAGSAREAMDEGQTYRIIPEMDNLFRSIGQPGLSMREFFGMFVDALKRSQMNQLRWGMEGTPMFVTTGDPFNNNIKQLLPTPSQPVGTERRTFWRDEAL